MSNPIDSPPPDLSRRRFLRAAAAAIVTVGGGLVALADDKTRKAKKVITSQVAPPRAAKPALASVGPRPLKYDRCLGYQACNDDAVKRWEDCVDAAYASNNSWRWKKFIAEPKCMAQLVADLAECEALYLASLATDAANWIARNPGLAALGAIVVIAGVTYIVVSGGSGALVLAPLL